MRVFLSYSQADAGVAKKLVAQLSEWGIQVWDPGEEVLPGANWALKIGQALQQSRAMIVLLSPNSTKSEQSHMPVG